MTTQPNTPDASDQEAPAPQKSRRFAGRRSATGIGGLGLLILIMISVSSFYLKDLPLLGAGAQYTAAFSEAAGLKPGNEVRVAGVKVGEVTGVELNGNKVDVHFRANNTWIGDQTQASIQIKTVLGQKYLALNPRGSELADPDVTFTDTVAPYDVIEAFGDAADQIENVNTDNVAKSLRTLANAFSGTSGDIGPSLEGISRLSNTIASRDQEVQRLLRATKDSSKILADRNEEFTRLIAGAGTLLEELNNRQRSISALLASTTTLSRALTGIVRDNEAQIGPALDSLEGVTDMLTRQNQNLRDTITYMAPFYRLYANVLGNGRWFESTVTNLLPPALPQQNTTRPPNMQKNLNNGGTGGR
ncbi:MCE family protein [Gordonia sp. PDNC005]|uniref:MCE family protein n=1 Tax=unclassified Gordonia (in: high G+C Gram-positive bacteria) TaxID=2657482 RepID=UPI001966643E|nr:MCE family protein [Gordonia sp. PDNC005]QRY61711.1 MCE family protein [Gordonia sp. PDNC005]